MSVTTSIANSDTRNLCEESLHRGDMDWVSTRLRVSANDGDVLSHPELDDVPAMVDQNHHLLTEADCQLNGLSLSELRSRSRQEIVDLAVSYTSGLRQTEVATPNLHRILCDGHQPLLFHSGVWTKNFVLNRMASQTSAVPLHLIVDNDAHSQSGIQVPTGSPSSPRLLQVDYAETNLAYPWEEMKVSDSAFFESFADRVSRHMNQWGISPVLQECWPAAVEAQQRGASLPECLTAVRHHLEHRWGVDNLELPMSQVCDSESFRHFLIHLLLNLSCFRDLYNQVLAEYRSVNKIRSHTHPVPELKELEGWLESPFWIWNTSEPQRYPLFVKRTDHDLILSANGQEIATISVSESSRPEDTIAQFQQLHAEGVRIRSRALTTTLFSRLFLSDLFMHGIGGAKYDEMTDRLIRRFYGFDAPEYLTISGTWHLPLPDRHQVTEADLLKCNLQLRELDHNPERVLAGTLPAQAIPLLDKKQQLIKEQNRVDAGERGEEGESRRAHHRRGCDRYRQLKEINASLAVFGSEKRQEVEQEINRVKVQLQANQVLQSREYAFCLFPEEKIKEAMTSLAHS